jgi:hypothetical protein
VPGSLFLDGKLGRRREQINALGGLVYLQDTDSKQKFLVDTGASVSVLPHTSRAPSSGTPLIGADGKSIPSWGTVKKTLTFGLHTFLCSFILAAVSKPILGMDFLAANKLLVDPSSRQDLDADSLCSCPNRPRRRPAPVSPQHSATWHPPSEISSPRFHPSSAMGPGRPVRNMGSNTPLKQRAARSSPRHAAWTRISCALQKLNSRPWRRPG